MERFTKVDSKGKSLPATAKKWDAVIDNTTGLMWSAADVGGSMPHADAEKKVSGLKLAGASDWRLPTVEELFPLADRSRYDPAIDTAYFPTCKSDWYWTASSWAPSPASGAWIVGFRGGDSGGDARGSNARVRAVRSVSSAGQ